MRGRNATYSERHVLEYSGGGGQYFGGSIISNVMRNGRGVCFAIYKTELQAFFPNKKLQGTHL
jgi:hypothetical protein